jgi:hypothetical protein
MLKEGQRDKLNLRYEGEVRSPRRKSVKKGEFGVKESYYD